MFLHSFIFGKKRIEEIPPPSFRFLLLSIKILDFGNKKFHEHFIIRIAFIFFI